MGRIFCNDFHTNENIILFDVLNGSHESWANFEPQMSPVAHFFCFTLTSTNQISSETPCKAKNPWCIWKTHQEGLNEFSNFYIKFEMKSGYTAFSFQPWRYKKKLEMIKISFTYLRFFIIYFSGISLSNFRFLDNT